MKSTILALVNILIFLTIPIWGGIFIGVLIVYEAIQDPASEPRKWFTGQKFFFGGFS